MELCEEQTQKIRKTGQKTAFFMLGGDAIRLKITTSQKAHVWPLASVFTKFQLPFLIWRGIAGRTTLSQGQKRVNSHIFPLN